ncbi:hypothetical protein SAMD00019534_125140, partial [Acytostelium subglobosum LB1]|uniref:hypothetical protein n=1 Tax=Acytostelium subglobosum LB1 TaxID=1410327 RepID=UPI000644C792
DSLLDDINIAVITTVGILLENNVFHLFPFFFFFIASLALIGSAPLFEEWRWRRLSIWITSNFIQVPYLFTVDFLFHANSSICINIPLISFDSQSSEASVDVNGGS